MKRCSACVLLIASLAAAFLLPACTTSSRPGVFERDGTAYGTTAGRFRGRWWNYYERGRSFLEGGYYKEAEADLRIALGMRATDQLWPRTYGMHFIPEYFPQRELGIVLFYQGRPPDARPLLEQSLEHQYSARAAFFLDAVRKEEIDAAGGDTQPPELSILSPSEGSLIDGFVLRVEGEARDDHFVARVEVNGNAIDIRRSEAAMHFACEVSLAPGQDSLSVSAIDLHGNRRESTVALNMDRFGPSISFDALPSADGLLRGAAYDPAGVASLEIGGTSLPLESAENNLRQFSARMDTELLSTGVPYTVKDSLGNATTGIYTPSDAPPSTAVSNPVAYGRRNFWSAPVITAWLLGAAPEMASPLRISFPGVQEGQQYFSDEIILNISVSAPQPLSELMLNGAMLPIIPARNSFTLSQRFRLAEGTNDFEALAHDTAGNEGRLRTQVIRAATAIDGPASRLSIAFLGDKQPSAQPETAELAEYVFERLPDVESVNERFSIVDRSQLAAILAEQQLSEALSSKESRLALGRLIPAEAMFAGRVRQDAESVEIVLEGASTETAERLTSRVEVAGPSGEIDRLIEDLGLRLVQEFPRARGIVLDRDGTSFTADLGRRQGLRSSFKCLIYRTEPVLHPVTKEVIGEKPLQVFQGLFGGVDDAFSTGQVLPQSPGDDVGSYDIQVQDFVLTK